MQVRPLGKSELVRIEARATVFATGNNIRLVGDMTRRVLRCRLDPRVERPELRKFGNNPVLTVLADRGKFIAAARTVVRAYVVAGKPSPAERLASFEGWSDMVLSALMWLGKADPVETIKAARDKDPKLRAMTSVFMTMHAAIGVGTPHTANEVIKIACSRIQDYNEYDQPEGEGAWKFPDLRKALLGVAGKNSMIDGVKFGNWLSRHKDKIAGGVRLEQLPDNQASRWFLVDN